MGGHTEHFRAIEGGMRLVVYNALYNDGELIQQLQSCLNAVLILTALHRACTIVPLHRPASCLRGGKRKEISKMDTCARGRNITHSIEGALILTEG